MRPVARPPWNPRWAALEASHAAVAALGEYCSACEIPLLSIRFAWNAGTGELVSGRARPQDWDDLFVLCPHCARAAAGQAPGGNVLLPDRDVTFALGAGAPFGHELRTVDVTERVFVVPNGDAAAGTVRLFGLNTAQQADNLLRVTLRADDPRLMLRTEAWEHANNAAMLYRQLTGDAARVGWSQLLAHAISSRGFWSVWAAVLIEVDLPLVTSALGVPLGSGPVAVAARAFPATRADWLPPPSDTTNQDRHG